MHMYRRPPADVTLRFSQTRHCSCSPTETLLLFEESKSLLCLQSKASFLFKSITLFLFKHKPWCGFKERRCPCSTTRHSCCSTSLLLLLTFVVSICSSHVQDMIRSQRLMSCHCLFVMSLWPILVFCMANLMPAVVVHASRLVFLQLLMNSHLQFPGIQFDCVLFP